MPKESLKDKLDGNELDLSLSELSVVPVKELAALPKATHLDFSCNKLITLPDDFIKLNHIVKLDLSKNSITHLPENFGQLIKLQHLDLFSNQLKTLPVSFFKLKSLKWLDLRDNPLNERLVKCAGDCLDDRQCRLCASRVVEYMRLVQAEQERQRQKQLQLAREEEAARKAELDRERERLKAEKKAMRERKRQEREANLALQRQQEEQERLEREELDHSDGKKNGVGNAVKRKEKTGLSCCGVFLTFLIGVIAIVIGLYVYCDMNRDDQFCHTTRVQVLHYYSIIQQKVQKMIQSFQ